MAPNSGARREYEDDRDAGPQLRIPVRAGPRTVAVTFVKKTSAANEALVRPYRRSRGGLPSVAAVTISGPQGPSGAADTPTRRRLFVCRPTTASAEEGCARRILLTLTRRAYRRAVANADIDEPLRFYREGRAEGGFETGIQRALERVLVSPEFLLRTEYPRANAARGTAYAVTDVELASRLSFFLWSSIPDDELLTVAVEGRLRSPGILQQQVQRMLKDERADALVTNFAAQWLYLRDLQARRPNDRLFPDFDDGLRQALLRETELFFGSILREDRSAARPVEGRLYVPQRAAGAALRHPERVRQPLSARDARPRSRARRAARSGQRSHADVLRDADFTRGARQMDPREHPRRAAASAAAQRAGAQGNDRRRQGADDERAHGAASNERGLRQLPCADGSARVRAREFRCGRTVADPGRVGLVD